MSKDVKRLVAQGIGLFLVIIGGTLGGLTGWTISPELIGVAVGASVGGSLGLALWICIMRALGWFNESELHKFLK